jgi:tRNA nucleotidyltransferase (CCA-adding enzyme)
MKDKIEFLKVGGCVRDHLLGKTPKDIDYIALGATSEDLINMGYKLVGEKKFAIFLNSKGEEVALPRTEKQTGNPSMGNFEIKTGVPLEEDLKRRDLTINSMAMRQLENGESEIVDPYNGQKDLESRVLRATSKAFAEDPSRVLRLARFKAELNFSITKGTLKMARRMTKTEGYKNIPYEFVLKELKKVSQLDDPTPFFEVLSDVDGLDLIYKGLQNAANVSQPIIHHPEGDVFSHIKLVVKRAMDLSFGLSTDDRFSIFLACLFHDIGKSYTAKELLPAHHDHDERGAKYLEENLKKVLPKNIFKLCHFVAKNHIKCHRIKELRASTIVKLIDSARGVNPLLLKICLQADAQGRKGLESKTYEQGRILLECFEVLSRSFKTGDIKHLKGEQIRQRIHQEKVRRIKMIER